MFAVREESVITRKCSFFLLVFVSYFKAVGVHARMRSCAVSNEPSLLET